VGVLIQVRDWKWEASPNDATVFRGFAYARGSAGGGWSDDPICRGGAADQSVLRIEVAQAEARDRGAAAREDGRASSAGLVGEVGAWLRQRVLSGRRCTLRGLAAELAARGVKTDSRAIWVFLHAEGLSFKKKRVGVGAEPSRHRP
jgi:hypothetical protein